MKKRHGETDAEKHARITETLRRDRREREAGYRDRALKLFPHVCGGCGREFSGKRLRELTVHHKDHNFKNNPPDGSNWELLCLYCHDNEHEAQSSNGRDKEPRTVGEAAPTITNPFDNLDQMLAGEK